MAELFTTQSGSGAIEVEKLWITCVAKPLEILIETLPPSTNMIWRNNGKGRVYKILEASQWEARAIRVTREEALKAYGTRDLSSLTGRPMSLEISLQRPTWKGKTKAKRNLYVRPDVSNFLKVAEDAVMEALGLDDSAVTILIAKKVSGGGTPHTHIKLSFLKEK